jgi:dTDP-4-amino-4,6-dideoxygalactose transaminase
MQQDFLTNGPLVEEFEEKLSNYVGAPAIVVSSGTAALHCAYAALELQPGDEVITPPLTFIATQATAAMFGATIKFADIQADTGNLDPVHVEKAITKKTRAIVTVDYAGHPSELAELAEIARRNNIVLIEDAAHSIGSSYKGSRVGTLADITTFSFFPTKNMTTGEGGAVLSRDPALLKKARLFSRQGLIRTENEFVHKDEGPWHQEVHEFGLNYRLPDILCALGISQLSRIDEFRKIRNDIFDEYVERLTDIQGLILPTRRSYVDVMWHLFPIRVPTQVRRKLFELLRLNSVGVQVNYLPAHMHPVFTRKGFKRGDFPNSEKFYDSEISLPMHANQEILNPTFFNKVQKILSESLS